MLICLVVCKCEDQSPPLAGGHERQWAHPVPEGPVRGDLGRPRGPHAVRHHHRPAHDRRGQGRLQRGDSCCSLLLVLQLLCCVSSPSRGPRPRRSRSGTSTCCRSPARPGGNPRTAAASGSQAPGHHCNDLTVRMYLIELEKNLHELKLKTLMLTNLPILYDLCIGDPISCLILLCV